MRTIMMGEAPPQSRMQDSATSLPFSGASGAKFSQMLGVDVTEAFDTRNLLSKWPGSSHKGSRFPMPEARRAAVKFVKELDPQSMRVILVGGRVAKAFRMGYLPQLEWRTVQFTWRTGTRILAVSKIPHPSGVNQQWNDPETGQKVQQFLLEELRRTRGTS